MGELDDKPGQVIWVKAKIYEYNAFEFKVREGGSALNRVAKEYARAREVYGFSEEKSLEYAAVVGGMYGRVGEGFAWDREFLQDHVVQQSKSETLSGLLAVTQCQ